MHFQNSILPAVHVKDLLNPNVVDVKTRAIGGNDLIGDILFPIYFNQKVSFQCEVGQTIKLDELLTHCDQSSLHFVEFPNKISINGDDILPGFKPHYFVNQKLKGDDNSLLTKVSFISNQNTSIDLQDNLFAFFEQATPVHWSLITISAFLFFAIIIICFLVSYFKKPLLCLRTVFLCCRGNCVARCFERKHENIKEHKTVTKTYKELLKNDTNDSPLGAYPVPLPVNRQPLLPSAPIQPKICPQGYSGCPCGPGSPHRCVGTQPN